MAHTLALISCRNDILLFGGADETGALFLQVGVIGRENYQRHSTVRPKKIVCGRKWRIETIYEIMEALVRHSDRQLERSFLYDGFARFSRGNDPLQIASVVRPKLRHK